MTDRAELPADHFTVSSRVCTIRDRRLANIVLGGLVAAAVAAGVWLAWIMLAGPWFADTLAVEATVASLTVLAMALMAWSLGRALGCGHCHTPACTCR